MKNRNILITGGLGFIGSHISNMLMEDNNVVIVDDFFTENIDNLLNPNHEKLEIIKKDICEVDWMMSWMVLTIYFISRQWQAFR